MPTLDSGFNPSSFESRLYAQWESSGAFAPTGDGPAYSILLPPPNVTGTLHMGHAFQHTLMDALVRYHRMRGYRTLWQMGTDHAGIATEMVVSRNLALEGKGETRDSLGREAFIEKVWQWKQHSGDTIERQMRRLGASGDWSRSVFTMDPMPSQAITEAFVRLHEEGLIYRGKRLVNWDPVLKTAISDLEVVSEEENGHLWEIRYPLADGASYEHVEVDADGVETLRETRDYLIVATTRPETMLGDTAAMVHPDDPRYAALHGKFVALPLTGRRIAVITDDYVDRGFGTGVVKVTPAHDFNDYAVGQRHGLATINIFTDTAKVLDEDFIPAAYRGLDRFDARKAIVADLEAQGLLVEIKPHKLQVPRGDRSGQVIEPFLTDQWFVKMDTLGQRGLELVVGTDEKPGSVKFVPPNWVNTYRHWMENLQDWCISRQLWWGHRIPAWFDAAGKVYVGRDEAEVRAKYALGDAALTQDPDVLETWFSSAMFPFSTQGWPDAEAMAQRGFDQYLPSSVLVTGFDIIFFWVARMVMMTDHFTGQVPFRDVYITGLVRDKDGQKMSKSKGNVLDPIDIIDGISIDDLVAKRVHGLMQPKMAEKIEKATRKDYPNGINAHGADALRFTMAALAGPGRDIKFDLARAEGYKNFCNKLWNATRFALMNAGDPYPVRGEPVEPRTGSDETDHGSTSSPRTVSSNSPQPGTCNHPVTDAEKWILSQLDRTTREAAEHFASYRFDLLAQCLYEFTWNQFCDWFVELAKPALQGDDLEAANSTRHTLLHVLEALLRLLHPLIPFVTEQLWQEVAPRLGKSGSLMLQPYPQAGEIDVSGFGQAEADIEWLKAMIGAVRRIRSELGVSPAKHITLLLRGGSAEDATRTARFDAQLRFLCKLERIEAISGEPPAAAPAVVGALQLFVPLEGLVDLAAERARLDKEIAKIAAEKDKSEAKLAKFGAGVPAAVVAQEQARRADWSAKLDALSAQRSRLG
ncbi:valine--tRNA ligase [Thermomonas sp.]|uniref:valine--tRNA ligase n=1 Tax=Thermomonas sp. TaxID=1971895 RepID=UPI001D511EC7|nr:valine--tRNA ligase [Thermomonas sp.]MBZ0088275.1 valine--tRNA ligase [Thermomonas sp.]MCO5055614.1 valine--tRNA ligase [Thermomonas sp.]HRO63128.1 valine--tRNA ligase [Thermomonas sp.]